jgi:hypothetical protein
VGSVRHQARGEDPVIFEFLVVESGGSTAEAVVDQPERGSRVRGRHGDDQHLRLGADALDGLRVAAAFEELARLV